MAVENKRFYLFDVLLFLLIILGELPKAYVLANSENLTFVANLIQIPLYLGLLFLIMKKQYSLKQLMLFAILGVLLLIGYVESEQAAYFRGLLLILAVKDIPFKRLLRVCRIGITSTFVFTIILWVLRISDSGVSRRGNLAFGYVHPNIAAQVIMIILLLWLAEKGEKANIREYAVFEIAAVVVILLTGTKTAVIIIALAPLFMEICKKNLHKNKGTKILNFFMEISQTVILLFTWWSAKALPNVIVLKTLDLIVTNRLFLNYYLFDKYPLKLFGQNVSLHESTGVYNNIHDVWGAVITCDNTYAMSLLIMGIVPTIIFLLGYMLLIRKAIKVKDSSVVAIAMLLALYAFCESQMVEIYNNFVYLYILAVPAVCQRERRKTTYDT